MSFSRTHTSTALQVLYSLCSWKYSCLFLSYFIPFVEHVSATTSSLLPSLSALLLLVPLVAASVGVLLWRQKHISDHGESSGAFFFWQLSVFGPSWTPIGCHWVMWPVTSSGVVVMNLLPSPLPFMCWWICVSVHMCETGNYLSVLRYWAISVCLHGWSREHLWESWGYQTGNEFIHFQ